MSFLRAERETLERYLPGLDKRLADEKLLDLEAKGNNGLAMFREAGVPVLCVPA